MLLKMENDKLLEFNKKLSNQRNELKDELLLSQRVNKEIASSNEAEIERLFEENEHLVDQNERKEYILQILEQRLVELEKFLRSLGREDPEVREQLKLLKVNPDLNPFKITNVIEQNNDLKRQLKEACDRIAKLEEELKQSKTGGGISGANDTQTRDSVPFEYRPSGTLDFNIPISLIVDKNESDITLKKNYQFDYKDLNASVEDTGESG